MINEEKQFELKKALKPSDRAIQEEHSLAMGNAINQHSMATREGAMQGVMHGGYMSIPVDSNILKNLAETPVEFQQKISNAAREMERARKEKAYLDELAERKAERTYQRTKEIVNAIVLGSYYLAFAYALIQAGLLLGRIN